VKTARTAFIVAAGLLLVGFVTGCGSREKPPATQERTARLPGSETAPTRREQKTATSGDARPVIVAFGDSLTAGVAGRSYPEQLQDLLDENHLAFRVENQGVSGDTSSDGLARIENVIAANPVLVILEFGGNDGLRGIPVEATRKNLSEMIERLQAAKIRVVLLGITLPPNYGPDYVRPFTAMFPELAEKYHLPYIPFLLAHVYQHPDMMQPDGIHPNGAGNKIVAHDVFELIRPILSKEKTAHS
jgi:acyl-CoA thioesterase-1